MDGKCQEECSPDCTGKDCGDDGCGDPCGTCNAPEVCEAGQCVCQPDCAGKDCGDDGCGASCGTCNAPEVCEAGQCVCQPDCAGKDCGDDGCGASCGTCNAPEVCDAGECILPPCDPLDSLEISVEYGAALQPYDNTLFPTYLAHLLGSDFFADGEWFFATFEISNTCDSASFNVIVSTELEGYLEPSEKLVSIAPGEEKTISLNPVLQFSELYSLPAPLSGSLHSEVALQNGQTLFSDTENATILPLDKIILGNDWWPILFGYTAHELAAVMVTPQDEDNLVSVLVADSSSQNPPPWGTSFPASYSFAKPGGAKWYSDTQSGIEPNHVRSYPLFMHAGETVQGQLTSVEDDSWFGDDDIGFYLMTNGDFNSFIQGGQYEYLIGEYDAITGYQFSHSVNQAGWYRIVLWNTPDNSADRVVTITRSISREETVRFVLESLFETLRDYGMNYTSISGSVFPATQTVRLPADTITQGSGNCIDGTFVFASALEAMGLEPLLVFVPGHAFVGVWDGCSSEVDCGLSDRNVWYLETTMVGSQASFWNAYMSGLEEYNDNDQQGDADLIDVKEMRDEGIWPVPK